jgi:hypothetical protein
VETLSVRIIQDEAGTGLRQNDKQALDAHQLAYSQLAHERALYRPAYHSLPVGLAVMYPYRAAVQHDACRFSVDPLLMRICCTYVAPFMLHHSIVTYSMSEVLSDLWAPRCGRAEQGP